MSVSKETIAQYLQETRYIELATVNEAQAPSIRTLGGFAPDGLEVYFSTGAATDKVKHIKANPQVAVLFQHENQTVPAFVNVAISGKANELTAENERKQAIAILSARSPKFKERAEKGELSGTVLFKITPEEIKVVDLSKGPGAVEVIK